MSDPEISVIVSTRDRAQLLPDLFAALDEQQTQRTFELVIIDNGSIDETSREIARLADQVSYDVVTDRLDRGPGPARGRNHALKLARGEILAFTDDDCQPSAAWLEAGATVMGDRDAVVAGRTRGPAGQPGISRHPMTSKVIADDWRYFATCNIFYRRSSVLAAEGFDLAFHGIGGEDTDLGLRVCKAGAQPCYAPEAVVVHPYRQLDPRAAFREAARWYDLPRLIAKHPEQRALMLHWNWFWKRTHPAALLALASVAGATMSPLLLAGVLPWLRERVLRSGRSRRLGLLWSPVLLGVDAVEIASMVRGSVRHRTLVL